MEDDQNIIEHIRTKIGLSRAKMLELIGSSDANVFVSAAPDPTLVQKAYDLLDAWATFVAEKRQAIDREFSRPTCTIHGEPFISTMQVSLALGIGDFHVSNLRVREILDVSYYGNRTVYGKPTLLKLISEPLPEGRRSSPLVHAFLRYLQDRAYAPAMQATVA